MPEVNLETVSLTELRALAEKEHQESLEPKAAEVVEEEPKQARDEKGRFAAKVTQEPEPETDVVARRVIDVGGEAGEEVFEAIGETTEEALEALADKIADAKRNATKKIREQELELRELRKRTQERSEPKQFSKDDEYILSQELQKSPTQAFRKMFKEFTGYEIEDFKTVAEAGQAYARAQQQNEALGTFLATHEDYEDEGKTGVRNGAIMRMKLAELGLPITSENLHKAYLHLTRGGLLTLKTGEANADAEPEPKEEARIEQPKAEVTQARTKRSSGISTQGSTRVAPPVSEPSEDDAYSMPMDKLRQLANKHLSAR